MPYMKRSHSSDGGIIRCPAAVGGESKDVPPGPRDLAEVMKYLEHTVHQVLECPLRRQRLELWCRHHFQMNSDFSGVMCSEDCFRWHIMVTAKLLGLSCPPVTREKPAAVTNTEGMPAAVTKEISEKPTAGINTKAKAATSKKPTAAKALVRPPRNRSPVPAHAEVHSVRPRRASPAKQSMLKFTKSGPGNS